MFVCFCIPKSDRKDADLAIAEPVGAAESVAEPPVAEVETPPTTYLNIIFMFNHC